MEDESKLDKPLKTSSKTGELANWIFLLTPIGMAIVFYIMFMISADIEQKGLFIACCAAAGVIGLESTG